eukprot:Partr_v1_DN28345_c1_g1_i1_m78374 putative Nephronophthisis 4
MILETPLDCFLPECEIMPAHSGLGSTDAGGHKRAQSVATLTSTTLARQNKNSQCHYARIIQAHQLHLVSNTLALDRGQSWDIRIFASFFDSASRCFMSNTHKSPVLVADSLPQLLSESTHGGSSMSGGGEYGFPLVDFDDYELIFHSQHAPPHVHLVFEFVAELPVSSAGGSLPRCFSLGWSVVPLWNPAKNGLNALQYARETSIDVKEQISSRTLQLPVYHGSPRLLLVIPLGIDYGPYLSGVPGAKVSVEIGFDQALNPITAQLPPFFIASSDDQLPSISISDDSVRAKAASVIHFSSIQLLLPREVFSFEQTLVDVVSQLYGSVSTSIVERRLLFRLHNGISFLTPASIVTLQPSDSNPFLLYFTGTVSFDKFVRQSKDVFMLVLLQYSVVINQRVVVVKKDLSSGSLFRRASAPKESTKSGEEKHINFGYTTWVPYTDEFDAMQRVKLKWNVGPNPFDLAFLAPDYVFRQMKRGDGDIMYGGDSDSDIFLSFTPHATAPALESVDEGTETSGNAVVGLRKIVAKSTSAMHSKESIPPPDPVVVEKDPVIPKSRSDIRLEVSLPQLPAVHEELQVDIDDDDGGENLKALVISTDTLLQLNRAQRGRLMTAGFDISQDLFEVGIQPVFRESPSGHTAVEKLDRAILEAIPNQSEAGLVFDFSILAITLISDRHRVPASVFFSFQVYRFPYVKTRVYSVGSGDWPLNQDLFLEDSQRKWPGILHVDGVPGCYNSVYGGIKSGFGQYLCKRQSIVVEIWDAESHFLVGRAAVPISACMKAEEFADVIDVDLRGEECSLGLLHCRVGLSFKRMDSQVIGFATSPKRISPASSVPFQKDPAVQNHQSVSLYDYRHNVGDAEMTVDAVRMLDADVDLSSYMQANNFDMLSSEGDSVDSRLAQKMEKIREFKKQTSNGRGGMAGLEVQKRKYRTISQFRDRKKLVSIRDSIEAQITTTHHIVAEYGKSYFFEFNLSNPFVTDIAVEIRFNDSGLRVITDAQEWNALKLEHGIRDGSVEDLVVNDRQVWLHGGESIQIPFLYQRLKDGKTGHEIAVSFLEQESKNLISLLKVTVEETNLMMVDDVYRIYATELDYIREKLLFHQPAAHHDIYLRSSNSNVIAETEKTGINSNVKTISLKYRCGQSSPEPESFELLFYKDKYLTQLVSIWKIYVHSMARLDVSTSLGDPVRASLICRGDRGRIVECWSMAREELSFDKNTIEMVGNALNEIKMTLKPTRIGDKLIRVNIVDKAEDKLIQQWAVKVHVLSPKVTKEFRVQISKAMNRRISFRNSYTNHKRFKIQSTNGHLLSTVDETLDVGGGKSNYIRLQFHMPPLDKAGDITTKAESVYVTLVDEAENRLEECLL